MGIISGTVLPSRRHPRVEFLEPARLGKAPAPAPTGLGTNPPHFIRAIIPSAESHGGRLNA